MRPRLFFMSGVRNHRTTFVSDAAENVRLPLLVAASPVSDAVRDLHHHARDASDKFAQSYAHDTKEPTKENSTEQPSYYLRLREEATVSRFICKGLEQHY